LITGTIVKPGEFADKKDRYELTINKNNSDALPHQYRRKNLISLAIGDITYEAGVHETRKGVVWISSVLHKKDQRREKARLVDALERVGLKKGDRIRITRNVNGIFSLSPYRPA